MCVFVCVRVFFFETKIYVLIHMRLHGRVSDEEDFTRPTSGMKARVFWSYIKKRVGDIETTLDMVCTEI